jgi:hypothetical protein
VIDEWDEEQLQASDLQALKGATIRSATLGPVKGFEYDAITLELEDGGILQIAPWDYEGYSAGLEKRWSRADAQ